VLLFGVALCGSSACIEKGASDEDASMRLRGSRLAWSRNLCRGESTMPTYRVFLKDEHGTLVGRDQFDAPDDLRALVVARMLCDACSDRAASCEVRQGFRLIDRRFPMRTVNLRWEHLSPKTQEIVYEREFALLESRWAIADSARLLEQTRRFSNQTRGAPQPFADRARRQSTQRKSRPSAAREHIPARPADQPENYAKRPVDKGAILASVEHHDLGGNEGEQPGHS
jgi:hypothetical protein